MKHKNLSSVFFQFIVAGALTYSSNLIILPSKSFAQISQEEFPFIERSNPAEKTVSAPTKRSGTHLGKYGGNECKQIGDRQNTDVSDNLNTLVSLVPGKNEKGYPTLTAQRQPVLWFYVPYKSETNLRARLELIDNHNTRVNTEYYPIKQTPGIVNILLPSPLEINQDYKWIFHIICNEEDPSADITVTGIIQRVVQTPNLTPATTAEPMEKAKIYAKDGLWNDALTTIIQEIRPINPQKSSSLINNWLDRYGLGEIANQPIVECCKPSPNHSD